MCSIDMGGGCSVILGIANVNVSLGGLISYVRSKLLIPLFHACMLLSLTSADILFLASKLVNSGNLCLYEHFHAYNFIRSFFFFWEHHSHPSFLPRLWSRQPTIFYTPCQVLEEQRLIDVHIIDLEVAYYSVPHHIVHSFAMLHAAYTSVCWMMCCKSEVTV